VFDGGVAIDAVEPVAALAVAVAVAVAVVVASGAVGAVLVVADDCERSQEFNAVLQRVRPELLAQPTS
jgi:hypothetical protein